MEQEVIPAAILAQPQRTESQNGLTTASAPELLGAFHSFIEQLNSRFGHTRSNRLSFGAVTRIIHLILVLLKVAAVLP